MMEVEALRNEYALTAAGLSAPEQGSGCHFIPLSTGSKKAPGANLTFHHRYPSPLRKLISAFIKLAYARQLAEAAQEPGFKENFERLKREDYSLVIVHHLPDLPLGVKLARHKGVKLIFNAHEYYPREFDNVESWMKNVRPYYVEIAREFLPQADAMFCVGEEIAKEYKKEFGVDSIVINNSKKYFNLAPSAVGGQIKMVHHGAAIESRKIELMIDILDLLPGHYTLDLVLVPTQEAYFEQLRSLANNHSRLKLLPAVKVDEIPPFLNAYDIGLYSLPPENFNDRYALPNKFFEFIQARLALVIGPSVEMASLVHQYKLGIVAKDFSPQAMADAIRSLDVGQIAYYKNQCHAHARELSIERNYTLIRNTTQQLISN